MTWVILVVALLVVVVAFAVALLALRGQMEGKTEVLEDQVRRFWPHRGSEPNSGQR
ncbi:MAG: hypothetical protein ACRDPI_02745 [Nocardioidaceae bacterium]